MKLIIDIPEAEYECAKQRWMKVNDVDKMDYYNPQWIKETVTHKMDGYISNGIPLNGITNGEVLKKLFPKIELGEKLYNTRRYFLMSQPIEAFDFKTTDRWWNTPYQKGGE